MMTLDEAIKHAEEVAEQNEWFDKNCLKSMQCRECAEEYRQLAEWLKNYKRLLEQEPCDFARWVATEIFDDNWEYNKNAFAELACRRLAKMGIVRAKGDEWELVESVESEES